jgi:hypothetical protein
MNCEPSTDRKKYMQDYFAKPENYDKMKARVNQFHKDHPERRYKKWNVLKNQLLQILGWRCRCASKDCWHIDGPCKVTDIRALRFDSINGYVTQDAKEKGGAIAMLLYYTSHPEEAKLKLQILCANCYRIKVKEQSLTVINGLVE